MISMLANDVSCLEAQRKALSDAVDYFLRSGGEIVQSGYKTTEKAIAFNSQPLNPSQSDEVFAQKIQALTNLGNGISEIKRRTGISVRKIHRIADAYKIKLNDLRHVGRPRANSLQAAHAIRDAKTEKRLEILRRIAPTGMTIKAMSEYIGCSRMTIMRDLEQYGIKRNAE